MDYRDFKHRRKPWPRHEMDSELDALDKLLGHATDVDVANDQAKWQSFHVDIRHRATGLVDSMRELLAENARLRREADELKERRKP